MKTRMSAVVIALGLVLVFGVAAAPAGSPRAITVTPAARQAALAATESTPAPIPVKLTINTPKIAVKRGAPLRISGRLTGAQLESDDQLVLKVYRSVGGVWKSRGTRVLKTKRLNSTTTNWWVTFGPNERGQFRVRAVLTSPDKRLTDRATKYVKYRVVSPKYVALTFDDGSWKYTDSIRRSLDKAGVKATFFMLGGSVRMYKAQAKRVANSGHQVAVHSMTHPVLPSLSSSAIRSQLSRSRSVIKSATGKTATWYRPPYGSTSARVRAVGRSLGLREMLWTVDTLDWQRPAASTIRARALRARTGGVVLMHDGGGNRSNTAAAVPGIIRGFKAKGYDLVTLDEWAALRK